MSRKQSDNTKGDELFVEIGGKKQGAALHETILEQGDHAAATEIGKEAARRAGLTEAQIEK